MVGAEKGRDWKTERGRGGWWEGKQLSTLEGYNDLCCVPRGKGEGRREWGLGLTEYSL